jgi:hypothetical protein
MPGVESFNYYVDLIALGIFLGKYQELSYMLHMMEVTNRLSPEQCEELLRLARAKERDRKAALVRRSTAGLRS